MFGVKDPWRIALVLALSAVLLLGCGRPGEDAAGGEPAAGAEPASAGFPDRDPAQPLAVGERGTITLTNDRDYTLQVQTAGGDPLYVLPIKKNTVIDPNVPFTIQTFEAGLPDDLAERYVAVGPYALELHAAQETGYGFALKPLLTIHYAPAELDAAKASGASLDVLKGNLIVLYKEQRSPKWVPQTSVSVDEAAGTVTVSNIAGAGAWRLVARK
jgi:hypothetical protein